MWWQELIDGYASNAATISTNRCAVSSPRSIPIAVLPRRSRSGRPSGRLSETGYRGSRGQGDQRRTVEAGVVEPVQQMNRAGPRGTDRKFADSPLEGDGFEPLVPDGAKPKPLAPGNGSSNPALSSGESHKPAGRNSLRVSVRKQTKPRSEVEVAKGSRSLLLCDARISVFHLSDGAAKKSAQAC